jgi:transcriptional regulator with XRE-family HTH domain
MTETRHGGGGEIVGAIVKRRREQRNLTAAELARRAGIGKASLSNLEAGRGNPTIDTLYAIAHALRLPVTDLLGEEQPLDSEYRPNTPAPEAKPARELLQRISADQSAEIWRLRMPTYTRLEGIPHATGTREHLFLAAGSGVVGIDNEPTVLASGDYFAFRADRSHYYETGAERLDATVILVTPNRN